MGMIVTGLAVRRAPKAAPEALEDCAVTMEGGLAGNFRGREKSRNLRQVTLVHASDWRDACAESGCDADWTARRCDVLVDGDPLPIGVGILLRIGGALLEITGECDPCVRMDQLHQGLRAALTPGWRGGRLARVVEAGHVAVGDAAFALVADETVAA